MKMAVNIVRDDGVAGSNPATPTSPRTSIRTDTPVLLHCDCLEGLPTLAAGSVDLVLADLPYGTTQNKWDSVIPLDALWKEYARVAKANAAIVLTAAQPFTTALISSNMADFRYCYVWTKNRKTGPLNAKRMPMGGHEDVAVFYRRQPTFNVQLKAPGYKLRGGRKVPFTSANYGLANADMYCRPDNGGLVTQDTVLEFKCEVGLHPTQKPVALMELLIRTYTDAGETVLDNAMGSGTTGVACINTGRRFVGIEKDGPYFEIARSRIEATTAKPIDLSNAA